MSAVFADSFYFIARLNPADQWHLQAVEYRIARGCKLLTTSWVLLEVGDAMAIPPNRDLFVPFFRGLRERKDVEIVPASDGTLNDAFNLFASRPDKEWPLTDCISFVVMREQGLTDALRGDRHFEQAGFNALLKS